MFLKLTSTTDNGHADIVVSTDNLDTVQTLLEDSEQYKYGNRTRLDFEEAPNRIKYLYVRETLDEVHHQLYALGLAQKK